MKAAIIGCGYVADFYMSSAKYHDNFEIIGAYDKDSKRLHTFCSHYKLTAFDSLDALLDNNEIELILNLTNPASHFELNKICLESGKHVYCEKPLAMTYNDSKILLKIATEQNRLLSSAPCSLLGNTAQTILQALKENAIGKVRLVYASFDAGMSAKSKPWNWLSASGAPWPAKDEFEVGCTYEHAGYILTWLAAFFGPAKSITSFASCLATDKGITVDHMAPDFTCGCIEYDDNITARVTCSLAAPSDRSLQIIGDEGVISVKDIRDDTCPVYIHSQSKSRVKSAIEHRLIHLQNKLEPLLNWLPWSWGRYFRFAKNYPLINKPKARYSAKYKPVDFCRGPAALATAIEQNKAPALSADFAAHILELTEALQHPERFNPKHQLASSFKPGDFSIKKP